jgi:hypothetical protein
MDHQPCASELDGRLEYLDIPLLHFTGAHAHDNDEALLTSIALEVHIGNDLHACEVAGVEEIQVAQSLRYLLLFAPSGSRLEILRCISSELSKIENGKRVEYRWAVLSWYVKMWWAAHCLEKRAEGACCQRPMNGFSSWLGGSPCEPPTELCQFLEAFTAYGCEVVLLSGLEAANLEILLDAFAQVILELEEFNVFNGSTYAPMTSVARFAASGEPAAMDGRVPDHTDILGSLSRVALVTATEHKTGVKVPKRSATDIARLAKGYGLRQDCLEHLYKLVRKHPITYAR